MTDDEIKKLADLIARKVIINLTNYEFEVFDPPDEDEEEILLAELSKLMTLLSSYLKKEQYDKCAEIQKKINQIENRLNKDE